MSSPGKIVFILTSVFSICSIFLFFETEHSFIAVRYRRDWKGNPADYTIVNWEILGQMFKYG